LAEHDVQCYMYIKNFLTYSAEPRITLCRTL